MREGGGRNEGRRVPLDRPAFPPSLRRFVELFNRGLYWESHEALEDDWRRLGSDFYQGLILYASAFVHAQRGNRHGILAQLDKAEERLHPYLPSYMGIDVAGIFTHAHVCREVMRANPGVDRHAWGRLIPSPRLALAVERVRGDEPELAASAG
jgi:hypothetical protein